LKAKKNEMEKILIHAAKRQEKSENTKEIDTHREYDEVLKAKKSVAEKSHKCD
jgi:hypothetical protein